MGRCARRIGGLEDFVLDQGHLVLVEENDGVWRSALRAASCGRVHWFIEAVETDPRAGARATAGSCCCLQRSACDLSARGVVSRIHESNTASRRLYESCGFVPTEEPPVNPWGELEEGCILYGLTLGGRSAHA